MIDRCFTHCPGVGPETDRMLRLRGFHNWEQCIRNRNILPLGESRKSSFIMSLEESMSAMHDNDIGFFVKKFPVREHWRILATWFEDATFFDIETTGLSRYYSECSVITAYSQGEMHLFLYDENLDGFLDLVSGSRLLVSFNGTCFDLPFLEKTFSIPEIDCPHVDLRWVAYHCGMRGGLKTIERKMNYTRPEEIADITGFEAVDLFYRWQGGETRAMELLAGYCMADTVSTMLIAEKIMKKMGVLLEDSDPLELFTRAARIASCADRHNEPARIAVADPGMPGHIVKSQAERRRKIMAMRNGASAELKGL